MDYHDLEVVKLVPFADLKYSSDEAAGADISTPADFFLEPHSRKLIKIGLKVAIPKGYYGRIAPRSSLAKDGIDVGAGVIDSDYRGEVRVLLINTTSDQVRFNTGEHIAQLILEKITRGNIKFVEELDLTTRGEGGFGSTGKGSIQK